MLLVQASSICKLDPLICNELGVLCYQKRDFRAAVAHLRRALALLALDRMSSTWQPVLSNLGHAYRKLARYDDAVAAFHQALGHAPGDAATLSALGLTHHLRGALTAAIATYHKALAFRADCGLTQDLLQTALSEHCALCCQTDDPGLM